MSLMPVVLEVAIVKLNWYKSPVIDQILVAVMQVQHESIMRSKNLMLVLYLFIRRVIKLALVNYYQMHTEIYCVLFSQCYLYMWYAKERRGV